MLWTYDIMMSFQKIYSPTQLANAMKLVRQQNGWTQSELAKILLTLNTLALSL